MQKCLKKTGMWQHVWDVTTRVVWQNVPTFRRNMLNHHRVDLLCEAAGLSKTLEHITRPRADPLCPSHLGLPVDTYLIFQWSSVTQTTFRKTVRKRAEDVYSTTTARLNGIKSSWLSKYQLEIEAKAFKDIQSVSYAYWTVHHLDSWIKIDQLDVTCFIISLFTAQHVSNVSTFIFRSLRLICWVISWVVLLW